MLTQKLVARADHPIEIGDIEPSFRDIYPWSFFVAHLTTPQKGLGDVLAEKILMYIAQCLTCFCNIDILKPETSAFASFQTPLNAAQLTSVKTSDLET
jgi:hypothetical protein